MTTIVGDYMHATEQLNLLTHDEVGQGKAWIGNRVMNCNDRLAGACYAHVLMANVCSTDWPGEKVLHVIADRGLVGSRIRRWPGQDKPILDLAANADGRQGGRDGARAQCSRCLKGNIVLSRTR